MRHPRSPEATWPPSPRYRRNRRSTASSLPAPPGTRAERPRPRTRYLRACSPQQHLARTSGPHGSTAAAQPGHGYRIQRVVNDIGMESGAWVSHFMNTAVLVPFPFDQHLHSYSKGKCYVHDSTQNQMMTLKSPWLPRSADHESNACTSHQTPLVMAAPHPKPAHSDNAEA
mgnify:FL=1